MKNYTKILVPFMAMLLMTFTAKAITRDQAINNAQTYINITNWSPSIDQQDFGSGSNYYQYTSTYRTVANGGYTYIYPNYPTGPYQQISGPPNPIVAYVYGGSDNPGTFLSRINSNTCPGGYNTSVWYINYNFGSQVPQNLAGIDCSGFVTNCWGMTGHPYSTSTIENICVAVADSQLKKGDILNSPGNHVVLYVDNDPRVNPVIYESRSVNDGIPPGVILRSSGSEYQNYRAYTIFPQFSGMTPTPDTTTEQSGTITIQLQAEGTKPVNSPSRRVTAEISNIQMWLDGNIVDHTASGPKNRQTIKYKVDSLDPGKHRVKVQCSNVVNGIAYEDTVSWWFSIKDSSTAPGFYACSDNQEKIGCIEWWATHSAQPYAYRPAYALLDTNNTDPSYALNEFMVEASGEYIWEGLLDSVDGINGIYIDVVSTSDIYYYPGCEHMPEYWGYWSPVGLEYCDSWTDIKVEIDGKPTSVTWDSTWHYGNGLCFIKCDVTNHPVKNPERVRITVSPSIINTAPSGCSTCGLQFIYKGHLFRFWYVPTWIAWFYPNVYSFLDVLDSENKRIEYTGNPIANNINANDLKQKRLFPKQEKISNNLSQNYPNPFIATTTIQYSIKVESDVTLKVYNLQGQLVKTLVNGFHKSGIYSAVWDGTNSNCDRASHGVYIYRIATDNYTDTKKIILLQ